MIDVILNGLLSFVTGVVSIIVAPLDLLLDTLLPSLDGMIIYSANAMLYCTRYFGWILDSCLIDSNVLSFFILFMSFRVLYPLGASAIKLAVKWWHALAP